MDPRILGTRLQTPTLIGCMLLKSCLSASLTRHQRRHRFLQFFYIPVKHSAIADLCRSPLQALRAAVHRANDYSTEVMDVWPFSVGGSTFVFCEALTSKGVALGSRLDVINVRGGRLLRAVPRRPGRSLLQTRSRATQRTGVGCPHEAPSA